MSEPPAADSAAARLRALRTSLGLSQEQLARRLGVSFASVNRWESGRTRLSAMAAVKLAELEAHAAALRADTAALPVAGSSFVGRERELAEVTRLIRQSRLVTLTGPGGAGKTRLAAEALRRDFADAGVVFVPLDRIGSPQALPTALAFRLRVADQPGTPLLESLRSALAEAPPLLLLDGAERIAGPVAELSGALLAAVPGLRIVVTSRVVLGLPGEVCWTVPPLACPPMTAAAADIAAADAVRLFVTRASERLPDFRASDIAPHAIAELCRRLDGLPLAIELIASWVGTLSFTQILQQRAVLLDYEAGQPNGRRLADVLQVSYDLLTAERQRSLATLSVFAGGFGIGDIQAVLEIDAAAAAATARLLVDSSWLVVRHDSEQNVFSMLETIRTFAAARLAEAGDRAAVRDRHARHFAAIAAASESGLIGAAAPSWTARLERAADDMHAALTWADEQGDVEAGLDISAALWQWWLVTGRLAAGRSWLALFSGRAGTRRDERVGRALCSAAVLAAENGDYAAAVGYAEQAMAIFGPLGLNERMALAATVYGSAQRYLGDHDAARRGFETALDLRAALGDRRGVSVAMNNIALVELDDGNLRRAQELFEQALAIKRDLGERRSIGIGLANLADVLIRTGQWDAADDVLTEAATMAVGNPQLVGTVRCNQGTLAAHRQDFATAAGHFRAAIAAAQDGGYPHGVVDAMIGLGRVCQQAGEPEEAVRQLRAAQALAAEIGSPQLLAAADAALADIGVSARPTASPYPAVPAALPGNLTSRQAEVLGLLAAGLTNKQIAAALFLSTATVERHLATIYRNLGLTGRVEAARYALANGLARQAARQPGRGAADVL
jgi:predicted ATPase/DNA-binding CsgD family transcriptional regulator/DNA-binding XRE family transcriptional regulator/Tfp pilus assembly protein PilF